MRSRFLKIKKTKLGRFQIFDAITKLSVGEYRTRERAERIRISVGQFMDEDAKQELEASLSTLPTVLTAYVQ